MDLESVVTGAGGVAGVCAWVIIRQDRLIDALRRDLARQQDASREQMDQIYGRLLAAMGELSGALSTLERAVLVLRRGGGDEASKGKGNGSAV